MLEFPKPEKKIKVHSAMVVLNIRISQAKTQMANGGLVETEATLVSTFYLISCRWCTKVVATNTQLRFH